MRESVHGFMINENNELVFKFGFMKLLRFLEQTFYSPLEPGQKRPLVKYDNRFSKKTFMSINKLRKTLDRFMNSSRLLIISLNCVDEWISMQHQESCRIDQLPQYGPEDANFFLEITISYFRILVDDITDATHLFFRCLDQKDLYSSTKFSNLQGECRKKNNNLLKNIDPNFVAIISSTDTENGWFAFLNKFRNSLFHKSSDIQIIFDELNYYPNLIDESGTLSTNLIIDLIHIIDDFCKFMDEIFYHFYDLFLPIIDDKANFNEYCINQPFSTYINSSVDFLKLFPNIGFDLIHHSEASVS
jgi:hypothetical protein